MNPRLLALAATAALGPALMGALSQPRQRVEAAASGGAYEFVPICSGRVVQVRHGDAIGRLHTRHGPVGVFGGDMVTDVDLGATVETRKGERVSEPSSPAEAAIDEAQVTIERTFVYARGAFGVDWRWLGLRLGLLGGFRFDRDSLDAAGREPMVFPAFAARVGPQALHVRWSLADGVWDLRPTAMCMGIGFGLSETVDDHEPRVRGFAGASTDLQDANDGYFAAGLRFRLSEGGEELGALGRIGPDGGAVGLTLALPLR